MVSYTKNGIESYCELQYNHYIHDFKFFDLEKGIGKANVFVRDEKINLVKCRILHLEKIEDFILTNMLVYDKIIIRDCKNITLNKNIKATVEVENSTINTDNFTGSLYLYNYCKVDLCKYKKCSKIKTENCKIVYSSKKTNFYYLRIVKPEKADLRNVGGDCLYIKQTYIVNLAHLYNFNEINLLKITRVICRNKNSEVKHKFIKQINLFRIDILSLKDFDRSICNKLDFWRINNFRNDNLVKVKDVTWIKENKYFDYLRSLLKTACSGSFRSLLEINKDKK